MTNDVCAVAAFYLRLRAAARSVPVRGRVGFVA